MIFDTHAHYDDERFDTDREDILLSMKEKGVGTIANVSADLKGVLSTLELSRKYSDIYAVLGIHPDGISELNDVNFSELKKTISENALYNKGKVVAVGEIGLDYYYPTPDPEIQKLWFAKQIDMAVELNLPIVVHSRDACEDTISLLREHNAAKVGGIIHCYAYSVEAAKIFKKMGFVFGVGGVLTFKNAKKLPEVVDFLSMEDIVLETDSPYLCPVPHRGERNDSSFLRFVAQKIAEIKGISAEDVIEITQNNARRIYRINADT